MSRLGVHKVLGGDRARTAGPKWPKRYSTPYGVMVIMQSLANKEEEGNICGYGIRLPK